MATKKTEKLYIRPQIGCEYAQIMDEAILIVQKKKGERIPAYIAIGEALKEFVAQQEVP